MTVKNHDILMSEVKKILGKAAIEAVPFADRQQGFYSTFFLVTKKTGDYRAVINLRPLNQYLKTQHFKMDTMKTVLNLVKKGDWAFSVDLKDAYFHILIHPSHRKYLRFCIKGKAYQYRVLAFGPKTSPRVFTKVVAVVAAKFDNAEHKTRSVFGRLVGIKCNTTNASQGQKKNTRASFSTRFLDKFRKVKSGTNTRYHLHRRKVSVGQGNCFTNSRQNVKTKGSCNKSDGKSSSSKTILANIGCNGLLHRANPECKTVHETSAATSIALVETCIQRSRGFDSKLSASIRALDLVVTGSQHCKGQIFVSEPYKQGDCHGCIQPGLERQLGSSNSAGLLVKCRETTSHKLSGIGSSCLDCSKISSSISEPVSADQERQLYRDTVHQSSGGGLGLLSCVTKLGNFGN